MVQKSSPDSPAPDDKATAETCTKTCTNSESGKKTDDVTAWQIRRRRTFAIISHPDAGKTTLTEKLLLFGGAIQMAGTVKWR